MADNEKPYNVYGGLQDNGVYVGSSKPVPGKTDDWEAIMGGDGMMVAVDPRTPRWSTPASSTAITSSSTGGGQAQSHYAQARDRRTVAALELADAPGDEPPQPRHPLHGFPAPAPHPRRRRNLGNVSPDLTKNKKQGNVPFSTITVIAESPLRFGLLYVGTDDGNLQLTRNGGATWELVSGGLPADLWVSSVAPSPTRRAPCTPPYRLPLRPFQGVRLQKHRFRQNLDLPG
jgi:hypothetical protein